MMVSALKTTALIVFVLGFIGGIVFGEVFSIVTITGTALNPRTTENFNTGLMFITWVWTAFIGTLTLGFASLLESVQEIQALLAKLSPNEQNIVDVADTSNPQSQI